MKFGDILVIHSGEGDSIVMFVCEGRGDTLATGIPTEATPMKASDGDAVVLTLAHGPEKYDGSGNVFRRTYFPAGKTTVMDASERRMATVLP